MVGIILLGLFFILGIYVSIVEFYLKTESDVGKIRISNNEKKINMSNINIIDII